MRALPLMFFSVALFHLRKVDPVEPTLASSLKANVGFDSPYDQSVFLNCKNTVFGAGRHEQASAPNLLAGVPLIEPDGSDGGKACAEHRAEKEPKEKEPKSAFFRLRFTEGRNASGKGLPKGTGFRQMPQPNSRQRRQCKKQNHANQGLSDACIRTGQRPVKNVPRGNALLFRRRFSLRFHGVFVISFLSIWPSFPEWRVLRIRWKVRNSRRLHRERRDGT